MTAEKKKPLATVLTELFVEERFRLDPDGSLPWANMSDQARARELGAMIEVVRTLGLLGWEVVERPDGIALRRIPVIGEPQEPIEMKPEEKLSTTDMSFPETPDPQNQPSREQLAKIARAKGYEGIPCEACGSLNTVRNGKCLICTDCLASGECG